MKDYKKPQMIAKNLPTGSYAAGCPAKDNASGWGLCFMDKSGNCKKCDRAK